MQKKVLLFIFSILFTTFLLAQKSKIKEHFYISLGKREVKWLGFSNISDNAKITTSWSNNHLIRYALYLNLGIGYSFPKHSIEIGRFGSNVLATSKVRTLDGDVGGGSATVQELKYFYISDFYHPFTFNITNFKASIGIKPSVMYAKYLNSPDYSFYEGALVFEGIDANGRKWTSISEAKNLSGKPLMDHFVFLSLAPRLQAYVSNKINIWAEFGYLHGFRKVGIDYVGTSEITEVNGIKSTFSNTGYTNGSHLFYNIGILYSPFAKKKTK